jgi:hypothetical protein
MNTTQDLLNSPKYAPAVAAYDAIYDAHGVDWNADFLNVNYVGQIHTFACKCGREFKTNNGRGLHIGATRRDADKAFDAAIVK